MGIDGAERRKDEGGRRKKEKDGCTFLFLLPPSSFLLSSIGANAMPRRPKTQTTAGFKPAVVAVVLLRNSLISARP
jgi:hypothetical protein